MQNSNFLFKDPQISEYISDGIISISKQDMTIKYINNKIENIFHNSKINILNKKINYFLDESSLLFDYIKHAIIKRGSFLYNNVNVKIKNVADLQNFYKVEVINNIELDFIIIILKLDNEILKINEENNAVFDKIDDAISKVLDTLKNPISNIKGSIQLIEKKKEFDPELKEIILIECQKLFKLINVFETRLTNIFEKKEKNNIHKLIRDGIKQIGLIYSKNIKIIENFDPSLPQIVVKKNNLLEAFSKIFKNSFYYIDKNSGYLKVSTKFIHGSSVKIPNIKNKSTHNFFNIEIEDNRKMVENSDMNNIFLPFFGFRDDNQSLGLYIAKKIINNHKGTINAVRCDGLTKIIINLPIL